MSTYMGVTNCQKQSGFLAHPVVQSSPSFIAPKPLVAQKIAALIYRHGGLINARQVKGSL